MSSNGFFTYSNIFHIFGQKGAKIMNFLKKSYFVNVSKSLRLRLGEKKQTKTKQNKIKQTQKQKTKQNKGKKPVPGAKYSLHGKSLYWATPFKIHTPPVEDLRYMLHRGSVNS